MSLLRRCLLSGDRSLSIESSVEGAFDCCRCRGSVIGGIGYAGPLGNESFSIRSRKTGVISSLSRCFCPSCTLYCIVRARAPRSPSWSLILDLRGAPFSHLKRKREQEKGNSGWPTDSALTFPGRNQSSAWVLYISPSPPFLSLCHETHSFCLAGFCDLI